MDTNKILSADLLDLVFDDRNKEYGAYELRRTYEKRIKKAMIITGTIALLGFSGTLLASKLKPSDNAKLSMTAIELTALKPDPEPEPLPPPKPKLAAPQPVKTNEFTNIKIEDDDKVDKPVTTQDDLLTGEIGITKIDAPDGGDILLPSDIDKGDGIIEKQKEPESGIWEGPIEINAQFDGNWTKFLENTLRGDVPAENGAPTGKYTVLLQFVVDVEGKVSDIKALTSMGYGMEEEAIRALKKAKKWRPAVQNGRNVPIYRRQPITFIVNVE